jgi:uncharacterized protein (DUF983 family)
MTLLEDPARPVPDRWTAIRRGFLHRCPRCGEGRLYRALLKFVEHCAHCGAVLGDIRADDIPAWLTVLATGHLVVPLVVLGVCYDLPSWLVSGGAVTLALALVALLLPGFKGAVAGLLWSLDMHGGAPE